MSVKSIYIISENVSALAELGAGAKALAENITAICFGDESVAKDAPANGASKMYYCPIDDKTQPEDYVEAIANLIKAEPKAFVFARNTIVGRNLAGQIGALLDTAVFTNSHSFEADGDTLISSRTTYGGTAVKTVKIDSAYGVFTINEGGFEEDSSLSTAASIEKLPGEAKSTIKRISREEKQEKGVNLVAAKRIIDCGRGIKAQEDIEICRKLGSVIGAELGCSRPMAENNKWFPKANYMGITGVQVKPDVIICCGVSGQIQHIGGINKSKVIVAINKDKGAPIFKNCDFGIVGDLYKVVPALTEKLS